MKESSSVNNYVYDVTPPPLPGALFLALKSPISYRTVLQRWRRRLNICPALMRPFVNEP